MKRLDKNNRKRILNLKYFLDLLNPKKYFTKYDLKGSCNYAFPIILETNSIRKKINLKKYY